MMKLFLVFLLMLPGSLNSFETEVVLPKNQPEQMESEVIIDLDLSIDPYENKAHTAKGISTNQYEHEIRFAEAKLLKDNTFQILLHDDSPSTVDFLLITVTQGEFTSQYWSTYPGNPAHIKLTWTTTHQKLILNQKKIKKKIILMGQIELECEEKSTDLKSGESQTKTIKIEATFRTKVKKGRKT